MVILRSAIATLVGLSLIAATLAVGLARGAMAADGQLCSSTGPAPLVLAHDGLPLLDGDGEPVTLDRELCVDCLLSAIALPRHAAGMVDGPSRESQLVAGSVGALLAPHWWMEGQARGPPA